MVNAKVYSQNSLNGLKIMVKIHLEFIVINVIQNQEMQNFQEVSVIVVNGLLREFSFLFQKLMKLKNYEIN